MKVLLLCIYNIVENPLKRDLFNKLLYFYSYNHKNIKRESVAKCCTTFIKNGIYIFNIIINRKRSIYYL